MVGGAARRPLSAGGASSLRDPQGACRLVFSEADLLPGLVVDRYGDHCVLQVHTPGAERMRAITLERLGALLSPAAVLDRSDAEQRRLEGLPAVDPDGRRHGGPAVRPRSGSATRD